MPLQLIRNVLKETNKLWCRGIKENKTARSWQVLKNSLTHLFFPARCLHCRESIQPNSGILCPLCVSLLKLIDPEGCCSTCFSWKEDRSCICEQCIHYPSLFLRMAAAFDYEGPAATLIKHLKYEQQPYLAKGIAAFMFTQFDQLRWPVPQALIPVPLTFTHWLERGYNQSSLIAEELAIYLQIPVWHALKRSSNDYSQAGLSFKQRQKLDTGTFTLNQAYPLRDKHLLVIDDVMTSGATLRKCAEALSAAYPSTLYALTCCRT